MKACPSSAEAVAAASGRLNNALYSGDRKSVPAAANELALAFTGHHDRVLAEAQETGATALLAAYPLDEIWARAAQQYNEEGAGLINMMQLIDPDAAPADVIDDDTKRRPWKAIPQITQSLERFFDRFIYMLEFAEVEFVDRGSAADWCGLFIDRGPVSAKEVVRMWNDNESSRGGRWTQLIKAGATPRVPGSPTEFRPAK